MKQIITYITAITLTISISYGQKKQSPTTQNKSFDKEITDRLTKENGDLWVKKNPSFKNTKTSFFTSKNEDNYFVGLLKISGLGTPLTWDDKATLLQFLLTLNNKVTVKKGVQADADYKGTKVIWKENINGLIWFNSKSYKATVDNWHLQGINECPETLLFPFLSFKKLTEIPNVNTNNIEGLTIFPYNEKIKIKSAKTQITTQSGKIIKGIGYDLNNDTIFDVFNYDEEIDEVSSYTRLFINVSGQWKCKWISLNEECI